VVLRDAAKGAIVAAVAIVLFYTLGYVVDWAGDLVRSLSRLWVINLRIEVSPIWIIVPELALIALLAWWLARRPKGGAVATRFLNILAAIATVMPLGQVVSAKAPTATRPERTAVPLARLARAAGRLPDIYYIILDGYARPDVMKEQFDLDVSGFVDHLERRGFFVARNATANYAQTPLCLSSSLNGTYLDEMVRGLERDQTALKDFIGRNDVVATLRPLGYRFVTFATGFEPTEHPQADRYLSPRPYMTEFQRMVVDLTPARAVWPDPRQLDPFQMARERSRYLLDRLPTVAADPRPTFTLAHLVCPHPPIVFGANGEDIGHEHESFILFNRKNHGRFEKPEVFRRGYRDQAAYVTRRVQETIDRILAESPEPPIIIVQSDHGSELELDMESVENTNLHERMSILNAYYFPGGHYDGLYDSISPVNSFRAVFNTFFGARLPLLPDRSYFSTWPEPYQFIDVTNTVRPGEGHQIAIENPGDS
jgi:hypothetical protein